MKTFNLYSLIFGLLLLSKVVIGQACPTYTNNLPIKSGYNYATGTIYTAPNNTVDPNWIVTMDNVAFTSEPRQAYLTTLSTPPGQPIISPKYGYTSYSNVYDPYFFEYKFCLSSVSNVTLSFSTSADDSAAYFINGHYVGYSLITGTTITTSNQSYFQTGVNTILIKLFDKGFTNTWIYFNGFVGSSSNSIFYPTCVGNNTSLLFNETSYALNALPVFTACVGQPINLTLNNPTANNSYFWDYGDGSDETNVSVTHAYSAPGQYVVSATQITSGCYLLNPVTFTIQVSTCPKPACDKCVSSFAPPPGEYIISCWVREDRITPVDNYNYPKVKVSFIGDPAVYGPYMANYTKNRIIDGWQRIEEKFTVPAGATDLKISLMNTSGAQQIDCYFDDIRVHPVDGNMKTYVYDPINLRLMAELDENNFATIYEYNDEGQLIRVKKETEKGIMTIKETRNSTKKQ